VHDHLDEGDGADADVLEVVRVVPPGAGDVDLGIGFDVVFVEGVTCRVYELDAVVELYAVTRLEFKVAR